MQKRTRSDSILIKIGTKYKEVKSLKCRNFYAEFVSLKLEVPTAIYKWEELYYFANFEWKYIFKLPYIVTRETSLQSLQYKILNRYIPCYENLHRWGKEPSDKCLHCGQTDTIEHFLFSCPDLKVFWSTFNDWWYNIHSFSINLSTLDVIFGVPNEFNDNGLQALTFACY